MLARHAENLFWAGRYVERAELTARMVDVTSKEASHRRADARTTNAICAVGHEQEVSDHQRGLHRAAHNAIGLDQIGSGPNSGQVHAERARDPEAQVDRPPIVASQGIPGRRASGRARRVHRDCGTDTNDQCHGKRKTGRAKREGQQQTNDQSYREKPGQVPSQSTVENAGVNVAQAREQQTHDNGTPGFARPRDAGRGYAGGVDAGRPVSGPEPEKGPGVSGPPILAQMAE